MKLTETTQYLVDAYACLFNSVEACAVVMRYFTDNNGGKTMTEAQSLSSRVGSQEAIWKNRLGAIQAYDYCTTVHNGTEQIVRQTKNPTVEELEHILGLTRNGSQEAISLFGLKSWLVEAIKAKVMLLNIVKTAPRITFVDFNDSQCKRFFSNFEYPEFKYTDTADEKIAELDKQYQKMLNSRPQIKLDLSFDEIFVTLFSENDLAKYYIAVADASYLAYVIHPPKKNDPGSGSLYEYHNAQMSTPIVLVQESLLGGETEILVQKKMTAKPSYLEAMSNLFDRLCILYKQIESQVNWYKAAVANEIAKQQVENQKVYQIALNTWEESRALAQDKLQQELKSRNDRQKEVFEKYQTEKKEAFEVFTMKVSQVMSYCDTRRSTMTNEISALRIFIPEELRSLVTRLDSMNSI